MDAEQLCQYMDATATKKSLPLQSSYAGILLGLPAAPSQSPAKSTPTERHTMQQCNQRLKCPLFYHQHLQ